MLHFICLPYVTAALATLASEVIADGTDPALSSPVYRKKLASSMFYKVQKYTQNLNKPSVPFNSPLSIRQN